jgi:hypothetical protein
MITGSLTASFGVFNVQGAALICFSDANDVCRPRLIGGMVGAAILLAPLLIRFEDQDNHQTTRINSNMHLTDHR